MNTVERSPSPLMFTKQHSDSEQPSPSSSLALPSVTSLLPSNSPQMKRKFVSEGVRRIKKLAKRSSTADNDYHDSGGENPFKDRFSRVMNQLVSSSKQSKSRPIMSRYSNNEDGYSSDPGITHDASDDEIDSAPDPDIKRQIATYEKKLQKVKEQLQQEEEAMSREYQGGDSSQENETGGGTEVRRSKPRITFRLKQSAKTCEQLKKKIEKYENYLELLHNGTIPEDTHGNHKFSMARKHVEDRIRSVGTTMSSGVKNRLMGGMYLLKIKKRPDGEEFEVDEVLNGSPQDSLIPNDEESISLAAGSDAISDVTFIERENIEKAVQEKIEIALRESEDRLIQELKKQAELMENQRMTIERLENQLTDIIDLHQQEVSELQQQLAQIQTHTMEKLQDFEETIEECQSKLKQLEVNMHLQEPLDPQLQVVSTRVMSSTLVTKLLSILLVIISLCLAIKTHFLNGYNLIKGKSSDPTRKYIILTFISLMIAIIAYLLFY